MTAIRPARARMGGTAPRRRVHDFAVFGGAPAECAPPLGYWRRAPLQRRFDRSATTSGIGRYRPQLMRRVPSRLSGTLTDRVCPCRNRGRGTPGPKGLLRLRSWVLR